MTDTRSMAATLVPRRARLNRAAGLLVTGLFYVGFLFAIQWGADRLVLLVVGWVIGLLK